MIPLKLQIKNFLSYGSQAQVIDFEPYNLICLSGKNGHGKSALLDAITWVIWGNARKISGTIKADEGILRLGQTQMMVILDFECNGQTYRIKREYAKTYGKPYAALEFGVYNEEQTLISLTEKKIRETQKKIENTIHLTMEAFVNSAFLRQGQANEFSKKSPKDRKEIFTQILGLQQYEIVKKLAIDKAKQANFEKEGLLKFQEKIELELQKKEEINTKIANIKKQLQEIVKQEKIVSDTQKKIETQKKKFVEDQKNYQIYTFQLGQLEQKEKTQQSELLETRNTWRKIHRQQLKLPQKAILEKEKATLVATINKHQQTLQKKLKIKEDYLKHKEELHKVEKAFYDDYNRTIHTKKIQVERSQLELITEEKTFKELLKKQCDQNLEKKQANELLIKLKNTLSLNEINKKEFEQEEKQFEKRKEYYQKYIAQGNWIKKELDSLKQKKILSQDEGNPSCPLCEQNLSSSRKKFLKAKFTKQESFLNHRFARLSTIIKALKEKLIEQHTCIAKLKTTNDKNKLYEVQIKELDKKLKTLSKDNEKINAQINEAKINQKRLGKALEDTHKQLKELEKKGKEQLHKDASYKTLLEDITLAEKAFKLLIYDENAHKLATKQLQEIEKTIAEFEKIGEQIALQQERKKKVHLLCISLKQAKLQKKTLLKKLAAYKNLEETQRMIAIQDKKILGDRKEINQHKEKLFEEKGALENQKIKLKQLEKESNEQKKAIENLNAEIDDYKTIASATGKNGIQALLIENAIPEVEQEANHILSRLTNNQAQIFIESLRDLKKGGTKETLDIKISDAAGIRSYELFSGGEAFRIDFALRIAISKLLARRAGTALQTLIIDEGFGSQDEEGLSRIMDAIYKIQDDFSKIIVVSHLSALKDHFPVHFYIRKGPNGSSIQVIEQG